MFNHPGLAKVLEELKNNTKTTLVDKDGDHPGLAKVREELKIDNTMITLVDKDSELRLTFSEILKFLASLNLKLSDGQLKTIITNIINKGKILVEEFFDMIKRWYNVLQEVTWSQGQELSSEKLFIVKEAVSSNNLFKDITIPHNPNMADNNFSGSHQDSYCSESVSLTGPVGTKLRVISKINPYGFTPIMACNKNKQMIGMSHHLGRFRLIVFDMECNIVAVGVTGNALRNNGSFAGGYFYLDNEDNAVVVGNNRLKKYDTKNVDTSEEVSTLTPSWSSDDVVHSVTGNDNNVLYSALPVWDQSDMYWCLLSGKYEVQNGVVDIKSSAYIAVVSVVPPTDSTPTQTNVMASLELADEYINNTFAVTEESAVFVTNGKDKSTVGYCYRVSYDSASGTITTVWRQEYSSCGFSKVGQHNIGSGTTPTVMKSTSYDTSTGEPTVKRTVVITDNDSPKMNVVAIDYDNGSISSQTPVFQNRRSANEASVIGVNQSIFVPNNFGHTRGVPFSQWVPTEAGMTNLSLDKITENEAEVVWYQYQDVFIAMSMLARESGIIFAHSGEWDSLSATEGPMYNVIAVDSFDGRVIWRVPIGRGGRFCHEYGGIYFNRTGDKIFMGTNNYLISIQNL